MTNTWPRTDIFLDLSNARVSKIFGSILEKICSGKGGKFSDWSIFETFCYLSSVAIDLIKDHVKK